MVRLKMRKHLQGPDPREYFGCVEWGEAPSASPLGELARRSRD